ncbi:hypothetical protein GLYMA_01G069850v4 [Glycine max]|nr:hypothetical protein GLYMA_01G069850v4 [Glycine max]KAH1161995.1 hypothetical protein GYH30_000741 [Glycine max]
MALTHGRTCPLNYLLWDKEDKNLCTLCKAIQRDHNTSTQLGQQHHC